MTAIEEEYCNASDPMRDELDLGNGDYYCEHGTFIGNPFGGDYMCGWCEDGVPYADYLRYLERMRREAWSNNLRAEVFSLASHSGMPTTGIPQVYVDLIVAIWVTNWLR